MAVNEYRSFPEFNVQEAKEFLAALTAQKALAKERFHPSRLDYHKASIFQLLQMGYTPSQVQKWLRQKARIKVVLSTVTRWIKKHQAEYEQTFQGVG